MPENDDERRPEVQRRELERTERDRVDEISRAPAHEQIAEPLIEDELRRNARVGARNDRGERLLPPSNGASPCAVLPRVLRIPATKRALPSRNRRSPSSIPTDFLPSEPVITPIDAARAFAVRTAVEVETRNVKRVDRTASPSRRVPSASGARQPPTG